MELEPKGHLSGDFVGPELSKKTPTSATRSPSRPWVLGTKWRTKESREGFHDPSIEVFEAKSTSLIRGWRFHKNGCPQHFGPKGIFSTHLGFALKTVFYPKNDKNKLQIKQKKTPALTVKSQSHTPHLPSPPPKKKRNLQPLFSHFAKKNVIGCDVPKNRLLAAIFGCFLSRWW